MSPASSWPRILFPLWDSCDPPVASRPSAVYTSPWSKKPKFDRRHQSLSQGDWWSGGANPGSPNLGEQGVTRPVSSQCSELTLVCWGPRQLQSLGHTMKSKKFRVEGTAGDHLTQHPTQSRVNFEVKLNFEVRWSYLGLCNLHSGLSWIC